MVDGLSPTVRGYLARAAAEAREAGEGPETQAALDAIARIGITPPEARSGYDADETILQAGQRQADAVLRKLRHGEIDEDTPYAARTLYMREFTLASGGPGFDVTFITDPSAEDEVLEGWCTYYEATNVRIPLPLSTAMSLYEALNQPKEG